MADILTYTINLNGNVTKGVLDLQGAASKASTAMDKLHRKVNIFANLGFAVQHAAAVIGKFTAAMDKCVRAYELQAVAEKKLETLMRNNIGATADQIQSIKDLTSAQQKLGVIGDEIQLAGAQELSTYVTKTESLKKLIPAMNDMLAQQYGLNTTQEQAVTIAQMMGKVLDGQVGALSRYGYRFTDAQEKILKFGTEEQKVSMLSQILEQYVGGVNAALAATPEGKWKQHENEVDDLYERIGKLFVSVRTAMMPVFEFFSGLIERITSFFETNMESINKIASFIGGTLVAALSVVSGALGVTWDIVSGLFSAITDSFPYILTAAGAYLAYLVAINYQFYAYTIKFYAYHIAVKIATVLTKIWGAAVRSAFGVLGLLIGAVTIAVSLFKAFTSSQNTLSKITSNLAAKINSEQREMNSLFEALKKTNPESEERKRLLQEMDEKYPGFLNKQALEKANEDELEEARRKANDELARSIYLQELKDKQGEAQKKIQEREQDLFKKFSEIYGGNITEDLKNKINGTFDAVKSEAQKKLDTGEWSEAVFGEYASHGMVSDVMIAVQKAMNLSKVEMYALNGTLRELVDEQLYQQHIISGLENYVGTKELGTNATIQALAGGGNGNGNGNNTPQTIEDANKAVATGGSRNNTINISLKNMIEQIHFNGTTKENQHEIERNFAEALYRVLGMAETALS
jgi:hypothetical protein